MSFDERAIGGTSRGREIRYEKVKTRRASRSWPNHAKCPASVSLLPLLPPPSSFDRAYAIHTSYLAREHYIARARASGHYHSHIRAHLQICTRAHIHTYVRTRRVRHKRAGRYLGAGLHYRTRESPRSEREKVTAERLKTALGTGTAGPSAKNQCDHPSRPANPSPLPPRRRRVRPTDPPLCSIHLEDTPATKIELRARCEKEPEKPARTVYVPANFHSDLVNPIYIVDRPSGNERRDTRRDVQGQTPIRPRSIVARRKKTRKNDRELCEAIRADTVLILIKSRVARARDARVIARLAYVDVGRILLRAKVASSDDERTSFQVGTSKRNVSRYNEN